MTVQETSGPLAGESMTRDRSPSVYRAHSSRVCSGLWDWPPPSSAPWTDHHSKPMPPFPRFCLRARPPQCRQEEYRRGLRHHRRGNHITCL